LIDSQKRRAYDQFGHAGISNQGASNSTININDIFGDIFGDIFQGNNNKQYAPKHGKDIYYSLNIDFLESFSGVSKVINIPRKEVCEICKGQGFAPGTSPSICNTCNGRGEVSTMKGFFAISQQCGACQGSGKYIETKCTACNGNKLKTMNVSIKINIPIGIDDGMKIKVNNEGESGLFGGSRGNLYVLIYVKPHKLFKRKSNNILCDIFITCSEAILGCSIDVPTIDGKVTMKIPSCTQPESIFRLKNKGMPSLKKKITRGDQLVRVHVEIPQKISEAQKEIMVNFSKYSDIKDTPKKQQFLNDIMHI
jgi:molecular chaperone DnaJ